MVISLNLSPEISQAQSGISITGITDNRASYSNNSIPKFEKFEINFLINNTVATQLQWPYDPAPPSNITPGIGISVDAYFLPPGQSNWSTAYKTPAFYYQPFDYQRKNNRDWLYPQGTPVWSVRFAPNQVGTWSYRLSAQDSSGTIQSAIQTFSVVDSSSHGFVKVSSNDTRYFEFDDGTYFPGLGYNMNWNHISWDEPVGDVTNRDSNAYNFLEMGKNGIQLIRLWLSEWSLYGAKWNPWRCILSGCSSDWPEIIHDQSYQDHDISVAMYATYNPCMSSGHWLSPPIAMKPHASYRVRVTVKTENITGPRIAGQPYGFVAKITEGGNNWLQGPNNNCQDPGVGQTVTAYQGNSNWTEVTGTYVNDLSLNYLSSFYLTLTNVTGGSAYVDRVVMEEDLGGGNYGPNIIVKPGMNHHQYMDQRTSFAFDKVVELAHQNGVYLRPVILEWQDDILTSLDSYGFFGNWRNVTKTRWYQQAYWRYLQARYGFSPNIHSWELVNEADPANGNHYAMTDELGKYMHCRVFGIPINADDALKCNFQHPNSHLVSTSTWTNFPRDSFWGNSDYPNVDFSDLHRYISDAAQDWLDPNFYDTAKSTNDNSMAFGAKRPGGAGKPVIRGETGLIHGTDTNAMTTSLTADPQGGWLRHLIWGGINSGGLIESYWYEDYNNQGHIYSDSFDLRPVFKSYYDFIKDIPLSNGNYVDITASGPTGLRVWGQKDTVNNRAHLWVANAAWRWNSQNPSPVSGNVTISGFTPNITLPVIWWNTQTGIISQSLTSTTSGTGVLSINISSLTSDLALKIGNYSASPSPSVSPTAVQVPGDANSDGHVDGIDYVIWLNHYGQNVSGVAVGDFNNNNTVDGVDYVIWLNNYGN